jgi:hypothetical protein
MQTNVVEVGGMRLPAPFACIVFLMTASGCASIPFFGGSAKVDRADAKNPAVEILALWQPSEGPGPNGVPIRGFGGQVYFFTQGKQSPVLVDGKVRIYVFDDRGSVQEQGRPIGEYDFDSAGWNSLAHKSSLGPAYSVFIPYSRHDLHQASCSLRIRFTPTVGPKIYSQPATVVLTGPPTKPRHGDETVIQPQTNTQAGARNPNRAPLSVNLGPSWPGAALPQQAVVPVAGADADNRLSLADDVNANEDSSSRVTPIPDTVTLQRSQRMKLQNAAGGSELDVE